MFGLFKAFPNSEISCVCFCSAFGYCCQVHQYTWALPWRLVITISSVQCFKNSCKTTILFTPELAYSKVSIIILLHRTFVVAKIFFEDLGLRKFYIHVMRRLEDVSFIYGAHWKHVGSKYGAC